MSRFHTQGLRVGKCDRSNGPITITKYSPDGTAHTTVKLLHQAEYERSLMHQVGSMTPEQKRALLAQLTQGA